jgi:curved DNA-binding protein CbpA
VKAGVSESEFVGRFKRVYREHVLNYHPDKLTGRPEVDRRIGEEVTRVLNALYQDIKV